MQCVSLGKVPVPTAGTPVALSATQVRCSKILISQIAGMTGKTYFGVSGLVKATFVGVIKQFAIPVVAAGFLENIMIEDSDGGDGLNLNDYYVDADVSNEGLLVTYWIE